MARRTSSRSAPRPCRTQPATPPKPPSPPTPRSPAERAAFLNRIADEIEARAEITEIGTQETGLPAARLEGERGRTTGSCASSPTIS
jgi:hypothetical protein